MQSDVYLAGALAAAGFAPPGTTNPPTVVAARIVNALATQTNPHLSGSAGAATFSVALAAALLTVYALVQVRRHRWPEVDDVVVLVAATTMLIAGLRLVVVALTAEHLGPFAPEDRIFIPIAGLALILLAIREIARVVLRR